MSACPPSTRSIRPKTRQTRSASTRPAAAIEIVRTYADEGKSGLRLDGRDALKQLIEDVQSGNADFTTILVYDVSRWGRFQDADESAYYEYICKRAGISVHYCAEQFENDGSPVATIVKGVKRAMAGEYSRELSAKVFAGQCRLIELGYRQGGPPGYGLRRRLIDQAGAAKGELTRGEHKSIQTDRVVLVPGPDEEVDTVRWMYRPFVDGRTSSSARSPTILNERGIRPTSAGLDARHRPSGPHQREIHRQQRLEPRLLQAQEESGFATARTCGFAQRELSSLSSTALCSKPPRRSSANGRTGCRTRRCSRRFSKLLQDRGYLSGLIIDETESLPSSSAYQGRFGSLLRAYAVGRLHARSRLSLHRDQSRASAHAPTDRD